MKLGAELCYFGGFIIDNLVEVSSDDEDVEPVTPESEQLKKSKIPCTVENVNKHFGRPLKDAAKSFGCKFYSTLFLHKHIPASYNIYK